MAVTISCGFTTARLRAEEWHETGRGTDRKSELPRIVQSILTPSVTASLPDDWQGPYTDQRAREWIKARDREGTNLIVLERTSGTPVGVLILSMGDSPDLHIGYMLAESAWGKGLATELVRGLVDWCRGANIRTIIAGVSPENIVSQRVLIKCGFSEAIHGEDATELAFKMSL